jgi:H+/Cl- antiporter ClcA
MTLRYPEAGHFCRGGAVFRQNTGMEAGKLLILLGLLLVLAGLVLWLAPQAFSWFGKLPGDIRIKGEHTYVFIPITSMLLLSLLLTLLVNLLAWILRRIS